MTSIDSLIIEWFNSGFATGNSDLLVLGNLCLVALSLLLAAGLTFIIGFEREYHGHAAGLRTHLLVGLGSALIMVISVYGFSSDLFPTRDPARLAAQVISGIGFLGAGTIVQTGIDVKGLTTASTLWLVMAIGLAAGSGNFVIAIFATVLSFFILVAMRKVERFASRKNPVLMIVVPTDKAVLKDVLLVASRYSVTVRETRSEIVLYQGMQALRITMRCSFASKSSSTAFIDELRLILRPLEVQLSADA